MTLSINQLRHHSSANGLHACIKKKQPCVMTCAVVFLPVFWECDTQAVFFPRGKLLCNGKICVSYSAELHGIRKL